MSNIIIRLATEADLDRITEIYADAVTHGTASYELDPPSRDEMGARFDGLMEGGFPYLVAEQGGAVLGYALPAPSGPARPIASSSRIPFMSPPRPRAWGSASS